jgi:hypothetical protein
VLESDTLPARGDAERPLDDEEILAKFHANADDFCGIERAAAIAAAVHDLAGQPSVQPLLDLVSAPPVARAFGRSAA